jgi:hypothetical protein
VELSKNHDEEHRQREQRLLVSLTQDRCLARLRSGARLALSLRLPTLFVWL